MCGSQWSLVAVCAHECTFRGYYDDLRVSDGWGFCHGSCSLNVQFRPNLEGYRTCSIRISGGGSFENVSISGRAVKRLEVDESSEVSTDPGDGVDPAVKSAELYDEEASSL